MNRQEAELHNERQRAYYAAKTRSTIAPAETAYVRRQIDEAIQAAGISPGGRILDAGCGVGRHSFVLAARGFQVEGLDLSPDLLQRLRSTDRFGIPTHCADIADPPANLEGRFDAVLGFFVLHHLINLEAVFAGVSRSVRPGGRLVFVEPNPFNPLYYVQIAFTPGMRWHAERGMLNMRRRVMFAAMRSAGLINPALTRFGFLPPFLRNRSWGGAVDSVAEAIPPMRPLLPFQVFSAERPL